MPSEPVTNPSAKHQQFTRWLVRITLSIWTLIYLICCARVLILKTTKGSVYLDFYDAGAHWINGTLLYLRGGMHEFRYSPLIAAFFVPFKLLPLRLGEFLWRSLNFAAFTGGLDYCCKTRIPAVLSTCQVCAVFLLCIPLAVGSLNNAQSNPLVLGLMLISIAAIPQKRWWLCAAAITVATCFKLYPIALGLLLILMFPRTLAWRLLVCLAIAALLPFVLQRTTYVTGQYSVWFEYLSSEDRQRGPIFDWYKDFRALWRVYVNTMSQRTYLILELITAAWIALACLLARLRAVRLELLLALTLSLSACWMTAFGPATESATYILLAPGIAWGIVLSNAKPRARLRRILYGVIFGLFLASQFAINAGNAGRFFREHLQPLPLAATLLLLAVLYDTLAAALPGKSVTTTAA